MKPSTPGALANVDAALALIEQAQMLLDRAAQKLSPIRRGAGIMDKVWRERERVRALWYVVRKAQSKRGMTLDSETEILSEQEEREREARNMARGELLRP